MELQQICKIASEIGYNGLELMFRKNIIDLERVVSDNSYCESRKELLDEWNLTSSAISASYIGKCVGDRYDPRLDSLVPEKYRGKPGEIQQWAIDQMMMVPTAAKLMGCKVVNCFLGSPIWFCFYSYPKTPPSMVEEGFLKIAKLWLPILDEFKKQGISMGFEVHPSEIAYDYYTTQRLIEVLKGHEAFGLNFDPSHLTWQGVDPVLFLRDFPQRIVHVHMKDVRVHLDGRAGILGSHLDFGDYRRAWDFRSLGHGQVKFGEIVRELNRIGYAGPLSVEWEDNGMDRIQGARESYEFVQKINFDRSSIQFDSNPKNLD